MLETIHDYFPYVVMVVLLIQGIINRSRLCRIDSVISEFENFLDYLEVVEAPKSEEKE